MMRNYVSTLPAADRLGSITTDRDGSFRLEFDDMDFRRGRELLLSESDKGAAAHEPLTDLKEVRPDLMLLVLEPDRPSQIFQGKSAPIFGRTERERILHMTAYTAWNAGRQEEFTIILSTETLANQRRTFATFIFVHS